ncbi:lytic transglycosylase domain-containing protein [Vogesella sp. LIG4]|uniref:lytic transglycosylase domain-containing protein n=1 Tax=Vogesella sp. LIG4 TaxID=1192162 RepID=UPI00081FFDFF|nr:lytic transglycosylase domain-containing protein [Vogesella sp. LIG4]SCK24863.1 Predicted soluble lytic transglycosylase fused to an ABC-type amino acid-binding protein [Vogesella sp. LIG4]
MPTTIARAPPPAAWLLLAMLAPAAPTLAASEDIYAFTDNDGVMHLSNVPQDQHYQLLLHTPEDKPAAPATAAAAAPRAARVNELARQRWSRLINQTALSMRMDAALLHAVVAVESGYNPRAVSPRGAMGLMQLMPATARRYGVHDPFDPVQNVQAGARYLRYLLDRFPNDLSLALAAYNAGEQAVALYNRVPPYRETQGYIPRVLEYYQHNRLSHPD